MSMRLRSRSHSAITPSIDDARSTISKIAEKNTERAMNLILKAKQLRDAQQQKSLHLTPASNFALTPAPTKLASTAITTQLSFQQNDWDQSIPSRSGEQQQRLHFSIQQHSGSESPINVSTIPSPIPSPIFSNFSTVNSPQTTVNSPHLPSDITTPNIHTSQTLNEIAALKSLVADMKEVTIETSNKVSNLISRMSSTELSQQNQQREWHTFQQYQERQLQEWQSWQKQQLDIYRQMQSQQPAQQQQYQQQLQSHLRQQQQRQQPVVHQTAAHKSGARQESATQNGFIHPARTVRVQQDNYRPQPIATANRFQRLRHHEPVATHNLESNATVASANISIAAPQRRAVRRPVVCCTESHLNNFIPIVAREYKTALRGKKVLIATDSMAQRIKKKEFYEQINGHATLKCFAGATTRYLQHYMLPHIIEECPSTLALHVGTNSLYDNQKTPEQIANEVIDAGRMAEKFGVDNVIISSLIIRRSPMWIERKRREVNNIIKDRCVINNFLFLDNSNIILDDISHDKVHLCDSGSAKFAKNLTSAINRFN